jgi:hypothetical protein
LTSFARPAKSLLRTAAIDRQMGAGLALLMFTCEEEYLVSNRSGLQAHDEAIGTSVIKQLYEAVTTITYSYSRFP